MQNRNKIIPILLLAVISLSLLVWFFGRDAENTESDPANNVTPKIESNSPVDNSKLGQLAPKDLNGKKTKVGGIILGGEVPIPVLGARVTGKRFAGSELLWNEVTVSHSNGSYTLSPVIHEEEVILVNVSSAAWLEDEKFVTVKAAKAIQNLDFHLVDTTDITINLIDGSTLFPVEDATIDLKPSFGNSSIDVLNCANGEYKVEKIKKGKYKLVIQAPFFQRLDYSLEVTKKNQKYKIGLAESGGLTGIVSNNKGDTIPNAVVLFRAPGGQVLSNSSNAEGRYFINCLRPSNGEVSVTHNDYAFKVCGLVQIEAGKWVNYNIVMEDGSEIYGVLLDQLGAPVAGATIWFMQQPFHTPLSKKVTTDNEGNYLFEKAAASEYKAVIEADGYMMHEEHGIIVPPGFGRVRKDFEIRQGAFVSGKVVDSAGSPIPGVSVQGKQPPARTVTDEDGDFMIWGLYNDKPITLEFVPDYHRYKKMTNVAPNSDLGAIKLEGYGVITGVVLWGQTALPGVKVVMYKINDNVAFVRESSDGRPNFRNNKLEPGQFIHKSIAPGEYKIEISTDGFKTKVIKNIHVEEGKTVDLGIISLQPSEKGK